MGRSSATGPVGANPCRAGGKPQTFRCRWVLSRWGQTLARSASWVRPMTIDSGRRDHQRRRRGRVRATERRAIIRWRSDQTAIEQSNRDRVCTAHSGAGVLDRAGRALNSFKQRANRRSGGARHLCRSQAASGKSRGLTGGQYLVRVLIDAPRGVLRSWRLGSFWARLSRGDAWPIRASNSVACALTSRRCAANAGDPTASRVERELPARLSRALAGRHGGEWRAAGGGEDRLSDAGAKLWSRLVHNGSSQDNIIGVAILNGAQIPVRATTSYLASCRSTDPMMEQSNHERVWPIVPKRWPTGSRLMVRSSDRRRGRVSLKPPPRQPPRRRR